MEEYKARQAVLAKRQQDERLQLAADRAARLASRQLSLAPSENDEADTDAQVIPPEAHGENEEHHTLTDSENSATLEGEKKEVEKKTKKRKRVTKKGKKKKRVQDDSDEQEDTESEIVEDSEEEEEAGKGAENSDQLVAQGGNLINVDAPRKYLQPPYRYLLLSPIHNPTIPPGEALRRATRRRIFNERP